VLSTESFQAFAKDKVLYCHVTTHIEGDADDGLLGKKGGGGWPYVVAMDGKGRVLSKLKARSVEGFEGMLEEARASLEKRKNPDLSTDEKIALLEFDISVGNVDAAGAKEALAGMKDISDEQRARVNGAIANGEVQAILSTIKGKPDFPEAGKKLYELAKAGRVPTNERLARTFWFLQIEYAESSENVELFRSALEEFEKSLAGHPRKDQVLAQFQKRLSALEAKLAGE